MKPGDWDDSNVMPMLTAKIHIFIESPTSQHTLATLRFEDVDDYKMDGFNHQNAIRLRRQLVHAGSAGATGHASTNCAPCPTPSL